MKSPHQVKPTLIAEMDVHQRHVRPELLGVLKRLSRARRHTYDSDPLPLQQGPQRAQKSRVVVYDETAQHHASISERLAGRIPASWRSTRGLSRSQRFAPIRCPIPKTSSAAAPPMSSWRVP